MKTLFSTILFLTIVTIQAQDLPYYEIPTPSKEYTAGSVVSRMVDGLGFRYYWATEGLTEKDLAFKPNSVGRNTQETVSHIYDLSTMLLNFTKTELAQNKSKSEMSFTELRAQTLFNLQAVSKRLNVSKDLSEFNTEKDGKVIVPFYNLINGPIADAIWHTGQLASFRRSSGNPINSKVNHFTGKVKS